jgi:hypothetical protein
MVCSLTGYRIKRLQRRIRIRIGLPCPPCFTKHLGTLDWNTWIQVLSSTLRRVFRREREREGENTVERELWSKSQVLHNGCALQSRTVSCVLDVHLRFTWSPVQPRMVFHRVFDAVRIATPRALTATACLIRALQLLRPARL